eukprot:2242505-Prorocentrum_lima.AAC.1
MHGKGRIPCNRLKRSGLYLKTGKEVTTGLSVMPIRALPDKSKGRVLDDTEGDEQVDSSALFILDV